MDAFNGINHGRTISQVILTEQQARSSLVKNLPISHRVSAMGKVLLILEMLSRYLSSCLCSKCSLKMMPISAATTFHSFSFTRDLFQAKYKFSYSTLLFAADSNYILDHGSQLCHFISCMSDSLETSSNRSVSSLPLISVSCNVSGHRESADNFFFARM